VTGGVSGFYRGGAKTKAYDTCIAPQAANRSCRGAVYVTDRAGVQPLGRRVSLHTYIHTYSFNNQLTRASHAIKSIDEIKIKIMNRKTLKSWTYVKVKSWQCRTFHGFVSTL